jgi:hypothetical protein
VKTFIVGGGGGAAYTEGQVLIFPEGEASVPDTLRMYSVPLQEWEAIPANTERFDRAWYDKNTTPAPPPKPADPMLFLPDVQAFMHWTDEQLAVAKTHLPKPDGGTMSGKSWWRKQTIVRWRQGLDVLAGKAGAGCGDR